MASSRRLTVEGGYGTAGYGRDGFVTVRVRQGTGQNWTYNAWQGAGRYRRAAQFTRDCKREAERYAAEGRYFARLAAAEAALDE